MELLEVEIEARTNNIRLEWTLRWMLSPAAMETILVDPKKRTASIMITVTSLEDRNIFTKNDISFDG